MKSMRPPGMPPIRPNPERPPQAVERPTQREEAQSKAVARSAAANKEAKRVYHSAGRGLTALDARIGERLRQIRKEHGKSLNEVGASLNIAYQQVQKYENGTNRISASMLYRLAVLYDRPVSYFFEGVEDSE